MYGIPVVALIVVIVVYSVAVAPPSTSLAVDFAVKITIQLSNSTETRFVIPSRPIGVAGGAWATHQYDGDGVDSRHYPIYTDRSPDPYPGYSVIHVRSKVSRGYTLGDFFVLWGHPLGRDNTLGITARDGLHWGLCVETPPTRRAGLLSWDQEVLVKDATFVLRYFDPDTSSECG